jgi:hypothetical protein
MDEMNRETRTWIMGLIYVLVGILILSFCRDYFESKKYFLALIEAVLGFFMLIHGFSKINKTID